MRALTPKQEHFIQEYVNTGGNASEAYRRAYPTSKTWKETSLNVNASKLLKDAKVTLRLKELQEKESKKHVVTREWIIDELKSVIAKSSQAEMIVDKSGGNSGEFKYDSTGVNKAIDTLNKMLGYYAPTKTEHSGEMLVKSGMAELYKVNK